MLPFKRPLLSLITALLLTAPINANAAQNPAIIEFFAFPGCAASPALDHSHSAEDMAEYEAQLAALPKQKFKKSLPNDTFKTALTHNKADTANIIALTCNVDYSQYDDTIIDLKRKALDNFCADRYYKYRKALKFSERKINAFIVLNGQYETMGELQNVLNAGIKYAKAQSTILPLTLDLHENTLDISLPKIRLDHPANITIIAYNHFKKTNERSGAIGPPVITEYANPVTGFHTIKNWDGRYYNLSMDVHDMKGDGYTLLIQDPLTAKILAAGKIER